MTCLTFAILDIVSTPSKKEESVTVLPKSINPVALLPFNSSKLRKRSTTF